MAQIAYVTYPGIEAVISAQFTLSHGITASVCTIEIDPQATQIPLDGTLTLLQNDPPLALSFPNCRVVQGTMQLNDAGLLVRLSIQDRRWKWRYSINGLSGSYNVRNPDMGGGLVGNTLDDDFKRTPHQLAVLCLEAMGEIGYDITELPNDTYPEVHWSYTVPAEALDSLVSELGCRIVLTAANTVKIARPGFGASLPGGAIETDNLTVNPPERPDQLRIVCANNRYQVRLQLWAVGEDVDGSIKIIDSLSYKPADGWGLHSPYGDATVAFVNLSDEPNAFGKVPRYLAQKTVWRWYRIYLFSPGDGPVIIPGIGEITKRKQILPIENVQVDSFIDHEGKVLRYPAVVYGTFTAPHFPFGDLEDVVSGVYSGSFNIDTERGIVMFDDPVHRYDKETGFYEAKLDLTVAVSVRDAVTFTPYRFTKTYTFAGTQTGTGPRDLQHPEILYNAKLTYDTNGNINGIQSNQALIDSELDYYLTAAAFEYHTETPQERQYVGLVAISPDGAIQQVTWLMHCESGFTTIACRSDEFSPDVRRYRDRRMYEDLRDNTIKKLKKDAAKFRKEPFLPNPNAYV